MRVRMRRCLVGLMCGLTAVNMKMRVVAIAMPVRVRMNAMRERMAKTPDPNRNQDNSDKAFRKGGNRIHREALAKHEREHTNQ